ncbi:MAG: hypothetical protein OSB61_05275 [Verrucomicrobiota bacterium]|nr:hypothetical protein [Verrucomicrobiota bacterium]
MPGAYRPLGQAARKSAQAPTAQTVLPLAAAAKRALDSQALGLHHSRPFYRINNGQTRNQNQGRG